MAHDLPTLAFVRDNPFFKKDAARGAGATALQPPAAPCPLRPSAARSPPGLTAASRGGAGGSIPNMTGVGCGGGGLPPLLPPQPPPKTPAALLGRSRSVAQLDIMEPTEDVAAADPIRIRSAAVRRCADECEGARRETVDVLLLEMREDGARAAGREAAEGEEKRASVSSGSDLEYGPGIVEKLRAKFARITNGEQKARRQMEQLALAGKQQMPKAQAKRYCSVDDILAAQDECAEMQESGPATATQTLDRQPRRVPPSTLSRRHSRSMADISEQHELTSAPCEDNAVARAPLTSSARPFVVHRELIRREREQQPAVSLRPLAECQQRQAPPPSSQLRPLSASVTSLVDADGDMVDIKQLRRMFDRPSDTPPLPSLERPRRERFLERGRIHATVPPPSEMTQSMHATQTGGPFDVDKRRDAPPPKELRLSAPPPVRNEGTAERGERRLSVYAALSGEGDDVILSSAEPEFIRIGRRLRRSVNDLRGRETHDDAKLIEARYQSEQEDEANGANVHGQLMTSPPDPHPAEHSARGANEPSSARRLVFERQPLSSHANHPGPPPTDSSPPPEEPLPPMILDESIDTMTRKTSKTGAARLSSQQQQSHGSTPVRGVSAVSHSSTSNNTNESLSSSTVAAPSLGPLPFPKILPKQNDDSGVGEMQRLLSRFRSREREEKEEKEKETAEGAEKQSDERKVQRKASQPDQHPAVDKNRFVPTVVGVRSSDGSLLRTSSSVAPPTSDVISTQAPPPPPRPNVVSISVRDDASTPSVIYTNQRRSDDTSSDSDASQKMLGSSPPTPAKTSATTKSTVMTSSIDEAASGSSSSDEGCVCDDGGVLSSSPEGTTTVPKRSAEPVAKTDATTVPNNEMTSPRKSLSAKYLEEKAKASPPAAAPPAVPARNGTTLRSKPYGDDAIADAEVAAAVEQKSATPETQLEKETESRPPPPPPRPERPAAPPPALPTKKFDTSEDEPDEEDDCGSSADEIATRHLRLSLSALTPFASSMIAGDGNPVRHSLLHLAMEEDVPLLLEAMSETYTFVFEDLERASTSSSGASSIMRSSSGDRKQKSGGGISFEPIATGVYTYLDESSAAEETEWPEGAAVSYKVYQEMVAAADAEEYARGMAELARWNAAIQQQQSSSGGAEVDSRLLRELAAAAANGRPPAPAVFS